MLLRLYSEISQELTCIVVDLKEVFDFPGGGALPVRCHGTRWITHKQKALQRVIDVFVVFIHGSLVKFMPGLIC